MIFSDAQNTLHQKGQRRLIWLLQRVAAFVAARCNGRRRRRRKRIGVTVSSRLTLVSAKRRVAHASRSDSLCLSSPPPAPVRLLVDSFGEFLFCAQAFLHRNEEGNEERKRKLRLTRGRRGNNIRPLRSRPVASSSSFLCGGGGSGGATTRLPLA